MDMSSDSDDSTFLFFKNLPKRKADCNVGNKIKKLKLNIQDGCKVHDSMQTDGETETKSCLDSSIHGDSLDLNQKVVNLEIQNFSSNEKLGGENVESGDKLSPERVVDYFSCPLCLKILHSESSHFSHMKQCAKKSKVNAKQLLEALQLHKQHLKERISAGLLNIPPKRKKIQVQQENGGSEYELALGLALSKSMEDTVGGKDNENFTKSTILQKRSEATLEKFGFTSFGKADTVPGKKWKNSKSIKSVLRGRTNEDREKLLTEKASIVLLVNEDTMIGEAKESLRVFHCKSLEKTRNKESHLWKLGESIEETEWYVQDLKSIIVEEKVESEEKTENQSFERDMCNIDEEISKLNLPNRKIYEDWRRLINSSHLSDLTLQTKDEEAMHLHSVVLYARHLKASDSDLKRIFRKFESCIVLKFLQYLYCGTLDGLLRGEVENLVNLAKSLEYKELLELLSSLKQSLSESRKKYEDGTDGNYSEVKHSPEEREKVCSTPEIEWERINSAGIEENLSESVLSNSKDQILSVDDECYEKFAGELRHDREEATRRAEEADESHVECSGKQENIEFSPLLAATHNNEERCERVDEEPGPCNTWNPKEDQSGMDMFEEEEILNKSVNDNVEKVSSNPLAKNDPECIEVSSDSVKSDTTIAEDRENEKTLCEMDYDIPYFDPYEHFNSDIPDSEPFPGSEEHIHSQSLIIRETSPLKSTPPKRTDISFLNNESPCVTEPGCCSTPNNETCQPSTSARVNLMTNDCRDGPVKKRRYPTPCSKINKYSGRFSKLHGSKSQKTGRKRKSKFDSVDGDSEKVACILTESILRELDKSIGSPAAETPPREDQNYMEVTPTVPVEDYVEDVSPVPDYSVMGASSIKKQLTKYGLKKSLSKNKAKKILRHLYEELHPIVNMKNGKIVKFAQKEKRKSCKGKKPTAGVRKKGNTTEKSTSTRKERRKGTEVERSQAEAPTKKKSGRRKLASPKGAAEEERQSCTSTCSSDGASASNTLSDGSCFEVEEPLTQGSYTSATDAPAAVYDFIHNNPDIHRQILMYEPIWLEDLQRKLLEKYNKKFKLTDLMDCLDAECVTFRCESQRMNNRRK